jgi:hypothetical protein
LTIAYDSSRIKIRGDSMKLSEHISKVIEEQGRTKTWVAEQSEINYKTFIDKLTRNTLNGEELIRVAKVLNIDLNKLKEER